MRGKVKEALPIQFMVELSSALIAALSTLLVGFMAFFIFSGANQQNALESNTEIVTQINSNLSFYISDLMNVSDYVRSTARSAGDLSIKTTKDKLESLKSSRIDLSRIAVFSLDGTPLVSTDPEIDVGREDIRKKEWFSKALEGEGNFYFTGPGDSGLSSSMPERVISYSSMITIRENSSGMPEKGILLINLNFNAVEEIAQNSSLPSSGYIYLITNSGQLVYHPMGNDISSGKFHEDYKSVKEHVFGSYVSTFKGKKRITTIEPVSQVGWRIVGISFMDDIEMAKSRFLMTMIVVIVLLSISSFVISGFIAEFITRPVKQLEMIMRKVQRGNFDVVPPKSGAKEIRSLSHSFASMISKIKDLMADIKKAEEAKRQHELDALQAKINPHFLYNTLDSMVWMAETGDKEGVVKMATSLAALFRISIAKGHEIITLKEEFYHTKSYLEIQAMRYKGSFTYSFELPEELENCPTIKLIIQPIVENSIYHGIKMLQEKGRIEVKAERLDEAKMMVSVKDNGVGMSQSFADSILSGDKKSEIASDGSGIALRNVEERIKLTYGDEYGLRIKSEIDEGTTVEITLPLLPEIKAVVIH